MECQYPNKSASGGYRHGCKCDRCQGFQQDKWAKDKQNFTLYSNMRWRTLRSSSKKNGYTPPPEEEKYDVIEALLLRSSCDCCGEYLHEYAQRQLDHNHENGKFRGVLCANCNKAEGHLGTVTRAQAMVTYMQNHS